MSNLKEQKLNNKGFSLVELIIVIAIMAVLIGVLAPQYLRYVERSRESSDLDSIDSMVNAVQIYSADPDAGVVASTIECSAAGVVTVDGGTSTIPATPASHGTTVADALSSAGITTLPTMRSTKYKDWTITFTATGMTFSGTNGSNLQTAMGH